MLAEQRCLRDGLVARLVHQLVVVDSGHGPLDLLGYQPWQELAIHFLDDQACGRRQAVAAEQQRLDEPARPRPARPATRRSAARARGASRSSARIPPEPARGPGCFAILRRTLRSKTDHPNGAPDLHVEKIAAQRCAAGRRDPWRPADVETAGTWTASSRCPRWAVATRRPIAVQEVMDCADRALVRRAERARCGAACARPRR